MVDVPLLENTNIIYPPHVGPRSRDGGFIHGFAPNPEDDDQLDAIIQQMVKGITGLPGTLVRPRWQVVNPKLPENTVNWCSVGVMRITPDANPVIRHHGANVGQPNEIAFDRMQRHEEIETLASFYGPLAHRYASRYRDGLGISQNRELLFHHGMGLVRIGATVSLPELISMAWQKRYDVPVTYRRSVMIDYPVDNLVSSAGNVDAESSDQDFNSTNKR